MGREEGRRTAEGVEETRDGGRAAGVPRPDLVRSGPAP